MNPIIFNTISLLCSLEKHQKITPKHPTILHFSTFPKVRTLKWIVFPFNKWVEGIHIYVRNSHSKFNLKPSVTRLLSNELRSCIWILLPYTALTCTLQILYFTTYLSLNNKPCLMLFKQTGMSWMPPLIAKKEFGGCSCTKQKSVSRLISNACQGRGVWRSCPHTISPSLS